MTGSKVTVLFDDGTRIDGYLRTKSRPSMGVDKAVSSPNGVSYDLKFRFPGRADSLTKRCWYEVVITAAGHTAGLSVQYRGINMNITSYEFQTGQLGPQHGFRKLAQELGVT